MALNSLPVPDLHGIEPSGGDDMAWPSKCSSGFTLIELLIVVAVIGVLAAIAIPNYTAYRTKTYNASAISDIRTARVLLEAFHGDNARYP